MNLILWFIPFIIVLLAIFNLTFSSYIMSKNRPNLFIIISGFIISLISVIIGIELIPIFIITTTNATIQTNSNTTLIYNTLYTNVISFIFVIIPLIFVMGIFFIISMFIAKSKLK